MTDPAIERQCVHVGRMTVTPYRSMSDLVHDVVPDDGGVVPGFGIAINPEKVMRSLSDDELVRSCETANVRFADGIGVVWILRRRGFCVPRLAGVDFWEALMMQAAKCDVPVYLLGAAPGVAGEVAVRLRHEHPRIRIVGCRHGYLQGADELQVARELLATRPGIVTIAMGSPRQEKLIARLRQVYPGAFYLGVGGTFDVYAGRVRRAPRAMQRAGLEWLYRLVSQPARAGRQSNLLRFAWYELSGRL